MIKIDNKQDCSGCSACFSICGKDAIMMKEDVLGFKYPAADAAKCVECGLCEKVCAFNDHYATPDNLDSPIAMGARQKDLAEVDKSRSGGIFAALADATTAQGGAVYGAGYDSTFRVVHKRATNSKETDELRGSKYVQSDMGVIFRQVERDLKEGRKVLFSGTPCQTAGLASYLRLKHVNTAGLIICDIVCHGVPSPYIWRDYLAYMEEKEGRKATWVDFRDKKRFGWNDHKETLTFGEKSVSSDTYTFTFYQHIMFRHSCETCYYTNIRRTGDITLADFWGWEKTDPTVNKDDRGLSLLLINTSKGLRALEGVSERIESFPVKIEDAMQPNLRHPSAMHPKRERFEKDYGRIGFRRTMEKYGLMGWRRDMTRRAKRLRRIPGALVRRAKALLSQ